MKGPKPCREKHKTWLWSIIVEIVACDKLKFI